MNCTFLSPFYLSRYRESTRGFGWYDWLGWFFPCFVWLRTYDVRGWLLVSYLFCPWLGFSPLLGGCSVIGQLLGATPPAVRPTPVLPSCSAHRLPLALHFPRCRAMSRQACLWERW